MKAIEYLASLIAGQKMGSSLPVQVSELEMLKMFLEIEQTITAGRAALANAEPTGWQPIETAPKDKSVMLHCRGFVPFYCGRKRYGNLGEPQQSELAWRCDSSGRFGSPTHWMPLPTPPKDAP